MLSTYNLKLHSFLVLSLIISSFSGLLAPVSQHADVRHMSGREKDICSSAERKLQAATTYKTLDLNIVYNSLRVNPVTEGSALKARLNLKQTVKQTNKNTNQKKTNQTKMPKQNNR